jgi:chromate transporter
MKGYLEVFLAFLKMGCFTFGGGYAMVPIVERELIKKRGWTNMDEVIEWYTIAQITPGIIAVNLSTFVGYKRNGILGGILATIAFVLPGVSIIAAAALLLNNFADNAVVQRAFAGIRIAVGALILDTVIRLVKGFSKNAKTLVVYFIVLLISLFPLIPGVIQSPVVLVLASGVAGLFIYREKKPMVSAAASGDNEK